MGTPGPSHAALSRALLARARSATLSTVDADGAPHGTLVAVADAGGGDALLLLSELAEHARRLRRDARCALLIAEHGVDDDPLAGARVTLTGRAAVVGGQEWRRAFVEQVPAAARYAAFADFCVWKVRVEGVRYIGGFAQMSFVECAAYRAERPDRAVAGGGPGAASVLGRGDARPSAQRRKGSLAGTGLDRCRVEGPVGGREVRVALGTALSAVAALLIAFAMRSV
jgi:hypothetical protein